MEYTIKERNKQVKTILTKEFGPKNVSVTGGRGTSYGWVHIDISVTDPCPFKQHSDCCDSYCKDNICKGNNKMISGGWGNTIRQEVNSLITDKVHILLKPIEFFTYSDDMGSDHKEYLVQIKWLN